MNITGNRNGALLDFDANSGALNLTDLIVTNTNAGGDGIEITNHTGNVTLHTVKVDENGDQGAVIVSVTGNVSVTNSSFDSNGISGASPYNLAIQATGSYHAQWGFGEQFQQRRRRNSRIAEKYYR